MASWRFYQGAADEWRWCHTDEHGVVLAASARGLGDLQACMDDAQRAGFTLFVGFEIHANRAGKPNAAPGLTYSEER